MTSAFCPFCNAALPPRTVTSATAPCPRCGEPVPAARWPAGDAAPTVPVRTPPAAKRHTLLAILSFMGGAALVGLAYALYTVQDRASHHPRARDLPPPVALRRPAELPALGLLPPDAPILAGIHAAELWQQKEVRQVLDAPPAWVARPLAFLKSAGIQPDDIDHIAAAVTETPTLRAYVIVRTRLRYDLQRLALAIQPANASLYRSRPLYEFQLAPIGDALLWSMDDRTLVALFQTTKPSPNDLQAIPSAPRPVEEAVAPKLRTLMKRLASGSLAWAVGDVEQLPTVRNLAGIAIPRSLLTVKEFAVRAQIEAETTLLADLFTGDAKASAELARFLQTLPLSADMTRKVTAPPADQTAAADQWVTLQLRIATNRLAAALPTDR